MTRLVIIRPPPVGTRLISTYSKYRKTGRQALLFGYAYLASWTKTLNSAA